jgi:glyoxylase-like metal-dependent hydrolase (beta-lactamase superfamily II)
MFRAERYPANWSEIRARILERADDACECRGECGSDHTDPDVLEGEGDAKRCCAPNGRIVVREGARWNLHHGCALCAGGDPDCRPTRIVLTVAHLDHNEANNDESNLRALCQRCHFAHDRVDNARRARATRDAKLGPKLPGVR